MNIRIKAHVGSATSTALRDALDIWQAGVSAVLPWNLFQQKIHLVDQLLNIDNVCEIDLSTVRRLIVVGAGKASAAMATALHHQVLQFLPANRPPEVIGWINAPEGTFERQLPGIRLHAARPSGINIPTQAAVEGTQQILRLAASASKDDVVLCLISGGGSALLVAPHDGVTLSEKQAIARCVAAAGGDILQLNSIRRCLSRVKGGGLARSCTAGRLISLIISDVLGDPLDLIASGPTAIVSQLNSRNQATSTRTDPGVVTVAGAARNGIEAWSDNSDWQAQRAQAILILNQLGLQRHPELQSVIHWLRHAPVARSVSATLPAIQNIILGNNADAVDAAGVRAVELGYRYLMQSARQPEGDVQDVTRQAMNAIDWLCNQAETDCWISGGEPSVLLPAEGAGKGGRNQQLSLCVLEALMKEGWPHRQPICNLAFVSGGTDGEDGPTDAAGACFDSSTVHRLAEIPVDPAVYRLRADAYHFFSQVGGLIRTGPTGTNVCDLRVALHCRKSE